MLYFQVYTDVMKKSWVKGSRKRDTKQALEGAGGEDREPKQDAQKRYHGIFYRKMYS